MKKLNILTDKTIKANKPKDKKYYLNDGDGLYLLITPNKGTSKNRVKLQIIL